MDLLKLIADQWTLFSSAPIAFASYAIILFSLGFAAGKLFFGTVAEVAKARLEAARDDLARLERRNADEAKDATFLRAEVAALRADVARFPKMTVGTGPPTSELGKHGDIYIQLEDSPIAIPESAMFITPPESTIESALQRAAADHKPVFLVIYDPRHPTRSKLAYSLGYFLEYQTTRRLVDEYFIGALVASTEPRVASLIPAEDPLENARWIILSSTGRTLRSEGLYANPDEGLKRTREAISVTEEPSAKS